MTNANEDSGQIDLIDTSNMSSTTNNTTTGTTVVKTEEEIVTDQEIDDLLRKVEAITQSSPIKVPKSTDLKKGDESDDISTDNSSLISPTTNDSMDSSKDEEETTNGLVLDKTSSTSNIPKSVSQALFTSNIKVTKIREKEPIKFISKGKHENSLQARKISELQKTEHEISKKINKLNKEIIYLRQLIENAGISSDLFELRKLKYAIEKLEEFLDQKQKEKYEVGMLLTRAVRKRIDSGESGEFWVN